MSIKTAMVLAAGKGTRLRPITDHIPKPLVPVLGRSLLDRGLDRLKEIGIERCVINVSHLGEHIIEHIKSRADMDYIISDERDGLRDSAGAFVHAQQHLGKGSIVFLNADTFWWEAPDQTPTLRQMIERCDTTSRSNPFHMNLMLTRLEDATGHSGGLDFAMDEQHLLTRAKHSPDLPAYIYAGAGILNMAIFEGATKEPHSLNHYFDQAINNQQLHGTVLRGKWITVGTPDALEDANKSLARLEAKP